MTGLGGTLNYQLFRDSSHAQNFGNNAGTDTVSGTGNAVLQSIPVYGLIPAGQNAGFGAYTDTVTATLTY